MQFQTFSAQTHPSYAVAILAMKLESGAMTKEYISRSALDPEEVISYKLYDKPGKKKPNVAEQREYLDNLFPLLQALDVQYLVVTDPEYFKTLTGAKKADSMLGYVVPNIYPKALQGRFWVLFAPNYRQVFHNPAPTRAKIDFSLQALDDHRRGFYTEPGHDLLTTAVYPEGLKNIAQWLERLLAMDCDLGADIEGFSLNHVDAGVGTIAFSWNQHEGIAFAVDLGPDSVAVRQLLLDFFLRFKHKMIWHNISHDVTVLISQLFMKDILDTAGLLHGLSVLLRDWEDTKLIAYLATNTCAGNKLGLKELAQEFAGNYAVEEITDIRKIPLDKLLEYNLVDACSVWYVKHKYWGIMVLDQQQDLYEELFKPAIVDIVQMQLTGLPVNMKTVKKARATLEADYASAMLKIEQHPAIQEFVRLMNREAEDERYQDWKERKDRGVKVRAYTPLSKPVTFNPNSPPQLQRLLYDLLEFPVIERTDTKLPATGAEVLEKLKAYTTDPNQKKLLDAFLDFKAVDKILGTFIPAFEGAKEGPDGWHYLFGFFNLGGTVSGRLSSSKPNLQNIPSTGNIYADIIKECVEAPPGWVFCGLDFNSLEDMISALTTRDPAKLKVYEDGFDGHCLRAYSYFEEMMPDIDPDDVDSINSIAKKYKPLRQESKVPTFCLTYQGTYIAIMAQCGFSEEKAKRIEKKYHELYRVSDEWVAAQIDQATKDGYVTCAFGLRVRTPLLAQVVRGNSATPHQAEKEGRTAGNALGQSYGLLNTRAWIEFMQKVRQSAYALDIRPCAQIHDAGYMLIRDDVAMVAYANKHLVEAVKWQDDPLIWHPTVKLGGTMSIFYPTWADEIEIPNGANENDIPTIVATELQKREEKKAA